MGIQRIPGLSKRGGVWHIDKVFRGTRICESTGTSDLREAQDCLTKRMSQIREAKLHGLRAARTFRCAATKYLQDNAHKKSIEDDASHLKFLDRFIGSLELKEVHMGSLQSFIAQRRQEGRKTKSINLALGTVRHILNLASDDGMDPPGSNCMPAIQMDNKAGRAARERAADEWGKRHEQPAPDGFRNVRVHDLKHTYGRRLRAAGVSFEDRQDLLGHRSGRITTHYSRAELTNLIEASEKVCETESRKSHATFWLRRTPS